MSKDPIDALYADETERERVRKEELTQAQNEGRPALEAMARRAQLGNDDSTVAMQKRTAKKLIDRARAAATADQYREVLQDVRIYTATLPREPREPAARFSAPKPASPDDPTIKDLFVALSGVNPVLEDHAMRLDEQGDEIDQLHDRVTVLERQPTDRFAPNFSVGFIVLVAMALIVLITTVLVGLAPLQVMVATITFSLAAGVLAAVFVPRTALRRSSTESAN